VLALAPAAAAFLAVGCSREMHRRKNCDQLIMILRIVFAALCALLLLDGIQARDIRTIFTHDEMQQCVRFRTPNLVGTPTSVHLIARCCGINRCSDHKSALSENRRRFHGVNQVGDNVKDCQVVVKSSRDGGVSWSGLQVVSPSGKTGYANGAGIYDRNRDQIVLQYQYIPLSSTAPMVNVSYFQVISRDDSKTWMNPVDITEQLRGCNPDSGNMQAQSAGNKVQTGSGRLLFAGHAHGSEDSTGVCLWHSDDGGVTYKTTPLTGGKSEVSVANTEMHLNRLLINGRGNNFRWFPHRTDYRSSDNGDSWSAPSESELLEDGEKACERALIQGYNATMFSSEPHLKKRAGMTISCSKDYGVTWPKTTDVNGDNAGGYSDLVAIDPETLLMVWEDNESGNMYSVQTTVSDWC
jgi:hypothetical protein